MVVDRLVRVSWYVLPVVLPLLGAAALCFVTAAMAWRRRRIPGGAAFAVLMLAIGEWTATYVLEIAGTDLSTKLVFDRLEYLGIVANPLAALSFALVYTGRGHWLSPRRLAALCLVPATTLFLIWTNPTNGLVQAGAWLDPNGPFPVLVIVHGPWFWLHTAYSYVLLGTAALILLGTLLRSPRIYRTQIEAMLLGILAPLLTNALYLSGRAPVPHLDLTPFAFTFTGLVMFVAFFRFGFLDRFLGLPLVARRGLVAELPDAVIFLDARANVVEANPAAARLFDMAEAKILGRSINTLLPDWTEWVGQPHDLPSHREIILGRSDDPRAYDVLLAPQYLGRKHLVGWIVVARDVTEHQRMHEAARRSERNFRLLIERATDIFTVVDPDGRVRYISPSVERVLGYRAESLVGTSSLALVHPDDARLALATLEEVMLDDGVPHSTEVRCRHADGSWRWCEVVVVNLLAEPAVAGIVSTMRDVTERKRIEAAREEALARERAARAQAEAAVRLRDDFLSTAAHELKTPITSLRIAAAAFERFVEHGVPPDSPPVRRTVRTIDESSARLTRLVAQLLEVSRLQLDHMVLDRTWVDLVPLVREAVEQAQARTSEHRISLSAPAEVRACVDVLRFEQVLGNLLDNALKFSPNGGPIDVTLDDPGGEDVSVAVRDHGLGIPPEHRARIFDRYFQAHAESYRSGLGVGLFLVRQIVELHGGCIQAEFPADGGTRFVLHLPRIDTSRPDLL